ncbi:response regulator [Marinomonas aquiplantarum]|uniref:Response regulator receiver domain-containing protein n=1 Tax=Marinomonas aquiplantarum TaxID=491951 RepID=A0A366CTN6_9GAMM|nr:response regulator [Marinomonas aquiplantarum]RBO79664.1 response regulator receiver domain-containing protein [Marinomonas aquiplantarum]
MAQQDFSNKKALLIEDMAEARIMQRKMLTDFGFTSIDIAMKAETAIELLRSKSFDVILSDYNLGKGKDGQQLLEEVRHSALIPNTATYLMVTAETSIEMVMGAIEYQPDGYVTKPFSQAMLQRRLNKLLETKERLYKVNLALDNKEYETAISEAKIVMDKYPSLEGKCERIMGDCFLELKEYKKALALFNKTIKSRKMPWALFGKAKSYYLMDELDKAEKLLNQLMLDNRFFVNAYDWLAKVLLKQDKVAEAQSTLIAAITKSPKNILRQMELGRISLLLGDSITAEMAYRKAVFLAKHSCYNTSEVYLKHLESLARIADSGPLIPRQKDNFDSTLKKIHDGFFDEPDSRAKAYEYEMDICIADNEISTAKQIFEVWLSDVGSAAATAPSKQQTDRYSSAFGS